MNNTVNNTLEKKTTGIYNWLNLFAYIAMVAINVIANALPLGGNTSGQVSDRYPSLFTPDGLTFSIWGLIYVMLGFVMVRQLISKKDESRKLTQSISGLFATSCALNIGWILCWHFGQITGATLIIFILLINLIILLTLVGEDRLMSITFGIYTAWISVASIATVFVQASYMGANMISTAGETYAVLAIVVAGALMTVITIVTKNWTFTVVGIWAFTGIIIRMVRDYRSGYLLVSAAAILMIVVMLTGTAYMLSENYFKKKALTDKKMPDQNEPAMSAAEFETNPGVTPMSPVSDFP